MASGAASEASDSASARMSRPSASVLRTSTVLPFRIVRTSPTRVASPPVMLSVIGRKPSTRTFAPSAAMARNAPSTAAAPPMSPFMPTMASAGFSDRPPESNVMPLPTSATVPSALAGAYSRRRKRAGCSEPRFTPSRPPRFCLRISFSSHTVTSKPDWSPTAAACLASLAGVSDPPGSFSRSHAQHTASATTSPRSMAVRVRLPPPPTSTTRASSEGFGSDLNVANW